MDQQRFDHLARYLAGRLPRRGLGPLASGLLAVLGAGVVEARNGPRGRNHRRKKGHRGRSTRDKGAEAGDKGSRGDALDSLSAAKKKGKCVPAGGSCKKPKKGKGRKKKAKKCCAGLSCNARTRKCLGGGGGGGSTDPTLCPNCASACRTCDETGCSAGCGEAACAAIQRTCQSAGNGSDHQALVTHLANLGFTRHLNSHGAVVRQDGVVGDGVVENEFAGNGGSALLRTVAYADGLALSVALVMRGNGALAYALYIDADGAVQRINPEDVATAEKANHRLRSGEPSSSCFWCTKFCNWVPANALCGLAGSACAYKVQAAQLPEPRARALAAAAFAICGVVAAAICQEGASLTCDKFCDGICNPPLCPGGDEYNCLGACCDPKRCERCIDGECKGCGNGDYCQRIRMDEPVPVDEYFCRDCPTCSGICQILDTPPDAAPGVEPCLRLICDGTCAQGGNHYCQDGVCVCEPDTCLSMGRICGDLDDGCGRLVNCGPCPIGHNCTDQGACEPIDPCEGKVCRWTGTFRQRSTFHGIGVYNEVTTLDFVQDVTYGISSDNTDTIASTQTLSWRTDNPYACEHLVQYGGWELPGHVEERVNLAGAFTCGAPGASGDCVFQFPGAGLYAQVQECATCVSGTCCTPGCHDVDVVTAPGARTTAIGVPIVPTLSGSDTFTEDGCQLGFCGSSVYERYWNFTYGPID